MAFLKALKVFIFFISIFKIIVPQYRTCGIENKPKCNVLLDGYLKCPSCENGRRGYVKVNLDERLKIEHIDVDCNKNLAIRRYLKDPHKEDYILGFYFYCDFSYMNKKVINKNPRNVENVSGTFVYYFGFIDLTTTQKRKYRKRRIGFRKNNF